MKLPNYFVQFPLTPCSLVSVSWSGACLELTVTKTDKIGRFHKDFFI